MGDPCKILVLGGADDALETHLSRHAPSPLTLDNTLANLSFGEAVIGLSEIDDLVAPAVAVVVVVNQLRLAVRILWVRKHAGECALGSQGCGNPAIHLIPAFVNAKKVSIAAEKGAIFLQAGFVGSEDRNCEKEREVEDT